MDNRRVSDFTGKILVGTILTHRTAIAILFDIALEKL